MKAPIITTPDNPVGVDLTIQRFQNAIQGITYLDSDGITPLNWFGDGLVYGNTRRHETTGEPVLYWKGKDYYKMIANDRLRAFAFFYESDPRTAAGGGSGVYSLNVVVWFDQTKYAKGLDYRIREFFINDVLLAIQKLMSDEEFDTINVRTTPINVYSDFTVQLENPQFLHPFDGFRVSFQVFDGLVCPGKFQVPTT